MYLIGFFAKHFTVAVVLCVILKTTYALDVPCVIQQSKTCQVYEKLDIRAEDDLNFLNTADVMQLKQFVIQSPSTVESVPKQLFEKLPNLEDVQFSGVQLNQLKSKDSFESANSLRSLEISRNKLKFIPKNAFALAFKLVILDLTLNQIEKVEDGAFNGLSKLKILYLDRNQIRTLKRGVFAGAPQLNEIYLNNNEIEAIKDGVFDLPELKILSIKNNLLRNLSPNVFATAPKLENIDLSSNRLITIDDAFDKTPAVTKLDLQNNPNLEDVNLSKLILLPALLWLALKNTSLIITQPVPVIVPTVARLTTLDLSDTNLMRSDLLLHLEPLKDLEKLYLQNNKLTKLDKIENIQTLFPKLIELNLSNNKLECGWLDTLYKSVQPRDIQLGDDLQCVP